MTQLHLLFPVSILEETNEQHAFIKDAFERNILNYVDENGMSDESTGHVTMHHEAEFEPLFSFATKAAKTFVAQYMIDPELFDYNVVKSWMNILDQRETPRHDHSDAHISFVYYINIPENRATPITFYNHQERHEPFPAMAKHNHPLEWNLVNSYGWSFKPSEGTLFVFPAKLEHYVEKTSNETDKGIFSLEDFRSRRVSIAGDIILTYKETSAKSLGLQPIANWRTF
jgi:uncharacterized protein (TIGR02466 family)